MSFKQSHPQCAPWSLEGFPDGRYYYRPLVGAELGKQAADNRRDGAIDMTATFTVELQGNLDRLESAIRHSWLYLRFKRPLVGCSVSSDEFTTTTGKNLPVGVRYQTFHLIQEQERWLNATIINVTTTVDIQTYIEQMLRQTGARDDVQKHAFKLYHVVANGVHNFVFAGSHATVDALCVVSYMDLFFARLVLELAAEQLPPQSWGEELSRLPIMFLDGLGIDPTLPLKSHQMESLMNLFRVMKTAVQPSEIGYKTTVPASEPVIKQIRTKFSSAESASILSELKNRGLTITHAVQAAIILAMPGDLPDCIALPGLISWRMAKIDINLRDRVTAPIECPPRMIDLKTKEFWAVAESCKIAFQSLAEIDPALHLPYWNRVNAAAAQAGVVATVPNKLGPPALSSLGDLGRHLRHIHVHGKAQVEVVNYSLAVRLGSPFMNCHLWSFRDQLYMQLGYLAGSVADSDMETFHNLVCSRIRSIV